MAIGDKLRNGMNRLNDQVSKRLGVLDELGSKVDGRPARLPLMLRADEADALANDIRGTFRDRGVLRAEAYELGWAQKHDIEVVLRAEPGAAQLADEIHSYVATRAPGHVNIRYDWHGAALDMLQPLRRALGSRASRLSADLDGTVRIEASTTARDLDQLRREAEALVHQQHPQLRVEVVPFRSAVSFDANTFRDDD